MNDHKKEETMLPDWMCSGETYVPSKDICACKNAVL